MEEVDSRLRGNDRGKAGMTGKSKIGSWIMKRLLVLVGCVVFLFGLAGVLLHRRHDIDNAVHESSIASRRGTTKNPSMNSGAISAGDSVSG